MDVDTDAELSRRALIKLSGGALGAASLAGVLSPGVATAAISAGAARKPKMVWVTGLLAEWTAPLITGMKDFTDRFRWDLEWVGPSEFDVPTILNMTEAVIAKKPNVLISMMNAPNAYVPVLQKAIDNGITVVINNVQVPEDVDKLGLAYVGQDEFEAGKKSARLAAESAVKKGRKNGVILVGIQHPDSANMIQQLAGAKAGTKEYNKTNGTAFTLENFADKSLNVAEGIPRYEAKLAALGGELAAIIASSHGGGQAAVKVLQGKKRRPGDVPIGVIGAVFAITGPQIKQGWVQWGLDQQTYMQGYVAAALGWAASAGKYGISGYNTGGGVVTKANINAIMKREAGWNAKAKKLGLI